MLSQDFSLRMGLLTEAACHLSYKNHTHNVSSTISASVSLKSREVLKTLIKQCESRLLLKFYYFLNPFIVSTTPNSIAFFSNSPESSQSFQVGFSRNISLSLFFSPSSYFCLSVHWLHNGVHIS